MSTVPHGALLRGHSCVVYSVWGVRERVFPHMVWCRLGHLYTVPMAEMTTTNNIN